MKNNKFKTIKDLFRAKELGRKKRAKLSWPQKIEILDKLQRLADGIRTMRSSLRIGRK